MDTKQDQASAGISPQAAPHSQITKHDVQNPHGQIPAPFGQTSDPHSERKVSGSSVAEMDRVRKEIRQLQEKRAAAMMNEVVELQRERDTALGRIRILQQTLEGRLDHKNVSKNDYVGEGGLKFLVSNSSNSKDRYAGQAGCSHTFLPMYTLPP